MRKNPLCFLLLAILIPLALTGCGSSGSGGDQTAGPDPSVDPDTGISYVSAAKCIECHDDFSWSAEIVADYLAGKHVVHSDHITAADEADGCLDCHDPLGDGPGLEPLIDPADVPIEGLAAVGCENCHGPGGDHFGVGPIPVAEPGIDACGQCHDALPESHLTFHPEADNIATNFVESRHYTASVRNEVICSKCHTDEGGRLYKDVSTRTQLEAAVFPVPSDEPVQCRTCHNPHNAGGLLMEEVESRGRLVATAEYATCTTCHMSDMDAPDDSEWMYHQDVYYRIITDTHYDDPATRDVIEGYAIDRTEASDHRACLDCHNVHTVEEIRADEDSSSFSNTINDQWSKSGHGGIIGVVKLAVAESEDDAGRNRTIEQTLAIKAAGPGDDEAAAWVHYDWDDTNGVGPGGSARGSCQECHTATGAASYLSDPAGYDAANNDFSYLDGWADNGYSDQNEMLYCWGCHSDNAGGLRNPGAISRPYTEGGVTVVLPDVGSSNVCINCHGARGNVEGYELTGDPSTDLSSLRAGFGPGTKNVTEAHYLVAAATIYQELTGIGYEYPTLDYADVSYFAHDVISLNADAPETGSGPCAACHMQSAEGHTFNVVDRATVVDYRDGAITGLKSTVCIECHDGEHGPGLVVEDTTTDFGLQTAVDAAAFLEAEAEGYHEALEILEAALGVRNINFQSNYPYFNTPDGWINEGVFGAAHNFNYLHHEPGAYAHNRYYAKRLLFDAIDWVVDDSIDGTISVDELVYPEAAHWFGADPATNEATRP